MRDKFNSSMIIKKSGRNDQCPCGSGKKYKKCCQPHDEVQASKTHSMNTSIPKAIQAALEHHQAGRLPDAEAIYRQILQVAPDHPDALHLLGVLCSQMGKHEIAVELIGKAILITPNYAEAHCNLGNALQTQGKLDAAVQSYHKAISIKPEYAEAYGNLGIALKEQGKLDAAVASVQKAILIKPDDAEAHYNLAVALQAQGKLNAAVESYRNAISIKPDFIKAYNSLASALLSEGDVSTALKVSTRALQIHETNETKALVVQCIRNVSFVHDDGSARHLLIRAISEPWSRPYLLVTPAISLIHLNGSIRECIERAANAWPTRLQARELFGTSGLSSASDDRLLQCLLENATIADLDLERFLTTVRFTMLDAATEAVSSDALEEKVLAFYCSVARQCFINEFVFSYTDDEFARARLLHEHLVAALESGTPIPALWLVAVAAYFPLHSLPSVETLLNQSWPDAVAALLTQQIREPLEERQYRHVIPRLTVVEDNVSRLVQQQYEENPYPKWVKSSPAGKTTIIDAFLRQKFPFAPFRPLGKSDAVDILIAGCGTGQHPIEAAQQFRGARVLAVDISLTSLCYAKRKTRELGLTNIEYAQADIMKLGSMGRTFDLIESVGVLHHLADPVAGLRELVLLTRPWGFMRLGFYSECARQTVVAARSVIADHGYGANAADIRRCREHLISAEDGRRFKQLTASSDFYGTSECRDLLFHVQEHRFTLPQIKDILKEFGLDFIGFDLEHHVMKKYHERFPDDTSRTNLDYWNVFEAENPNTFVGMYQFFVQKHWA
jgi:Tfp pilus assembly protein PilF/SAM-dependent methyltransferase